MTDKSKIISELNGLLEKCCDGVDGFKNAAELSNSVQLNGFLRGKSVQRDRMASELKAEIRRLGGEVKDTDGSMKGSLHQTWMEIKTAFSTNREETVLDVCEIGEESILDDYKHMLTEHTLEVPTRTLLQKQHDEISRSKRTIEHLEDMMEK